MPIQVSHEGNPPETPASLTVSGTLDGTVTLAIQFTPVDPESEDGVPRPEPPPPGIGGVGGDEVEITCAEVFAWDRTRGNGNAIQWSAAPCHTSSGDITRSFDVEAEVTISPSLLCYGIMNVIIPGSSTPEDYSIAMTFRELLSGAPIAGIAICSEATSADDVTCIALLTNWLEGTTGLYRFTGTSLNSLNNATVLSVSSYTPSVGDYYFLSSIQDPFENTLSARIYAEGDFGGTALWEDVRTLELTNNSKFGFVAVGGPTGSVRFGHTDNQECHSDVTVFGYNDEDTSS